MNLHGSSVTLPADDQPAADRARRTTRTVILNKLAGDDRSLHVITAPGHYILTDDVLGVPGKRGILIRSDHVSIDLCGKSVIGCPDSLDGIACSPLVADIKIADGVVRGWDEDGIDLGEAMAIQLVNMGVFENRHFGVLLGPGASLSNCVIDGNGTASITTASKAGCKGER